MDKAVFLDRDGVINQTIFRMGKPRAPYLLSEFELLAGVSEACQILKQHNYLLIVVTNQPDVARGWVGREAVDAVNERVLQELPIDELYACFHTNSDDCACRKPRPGMLLDAAKKWNIDLKASYMVGDRLSDIEAGQEAGCRSILISTDIVTDEGPKPLYQCESLLQATKWILSLT